MNVGIPRNRPRRRRKTGLISRVISHAVVVCILRAKLRMLPSITRTDRHAHAPHVGAPSFAAAACVAGVLIVACGARLQAQIAPLDMPIAPNDLSSPHVRPAPELRALVSDAANRSEAIRALIDRLETLDVTVYIRPVTFIYSDLEGRVALLAGSTGHRYLVIELACGRSLLSQMAALGHELYHAVEIANEPSVVDTRTLAALYERIGRQTGNAGGRLTFETDAAANAGLRARRELLVNITRRSHGT
jgi:hypothetical protein